MATVLDAGLAGHFSIIFAVILILVLIFAVLQWTKLLGENKLIHGLIAACIAILMLVFPLGIRIVELVSQWFALILIFAIFILLFYKVFGASDDNISDVVKNYRPLRWVIFIVAIVVIGAAIGKATKDEYGTKSVYLEENNSTIPEFSVEYKGHYINPLLHPNVLGMIVIMLIVVFAIALLAGRSYKPWP
jgi:hypothetical protein